MDSTEVGATFRDPERWRRVRSVLEEALERDASERAAYVRTACNEDDELAAEVQRLLEVEAREDRELEPPAGLTSLSDTTVDTWAGGRIGAHELIRKLGSGGMGDVFLARRADGAFERRVAIKLLRGDLTSEPAIERFRRERQVLANLEHPGIARLIEGGTTEDGVPYLVIEYVDGVPIDDYLDQQRASVRNRIELFLQVCDAVEHAHRHLVVHRDLKPSNILVNASGDVRLLDFGIAKVLDPEKTSKMPDVTMGAMRFMTPSYASPEQVQGRPITTASDTYSLGVVLFKLLTGGLPYDVETTSAASIERSVCEQPAERPSTAVGRSATLERRVVGGLGSRHLSRALKGDLDRIVLKALRKEPGGRYASVDHLAADLRRYLQGKPVLARPDSLGYRARKFVRRNRTGVLTACALVAALVSGLVVSIHQYQRAEQAWNAEREQRGLAEERLRSVTALNTDLAEQTRLAQTRLKDIHLFATRLTYDLNKRLNMIPGTTEPARVRDRYGERVPGSAGAGRRRRPGAAVRRRGRLPAHQRRPREPDGVQPGPSRRSAGECSEGPRRRDAASGNGARYAAGGIAARPSVHDEGFPVARSRPRGRGDRGFRECARRRESVSGA